MTEKSKKGAWERHPFLEEISKQSRTDVFPKNGQIFGLQGVIHPVASLGGGHKAVRNEATHMLGHGGGRQAQKLGQLLIAHGADLQSLENVDPVHIGKGFGAAGQQLRIVPVLLNQAAQQGIEDPGQEKGGAARLGMVPEAAGALEKHDGGIKGHVSPEIGGDVSNQGLPLGVLIQGLELS